MADIIRETQTKEGQPPAGGRQDHEAMRAASMRPVSGPAATDAQAAGGGLEVPGRDPAGAASVAVPTQAATPELIPGERDPTNLTHSQPGAMGTLYNADAPQGGDSTMTDDTRRERAREGGGDLHDRRQKR